MSKLNQVGALLGLMCKYACEECDFRIFSSPSPKHPDTCHLPVSLTEGSILDNVNKVSELGKELGEGSEFPFDYMEGFENLLFFVDNQFRAHSE